MGNGRVKEKDFAMQRPEFLHICIRLAQIWLKIDRCHTKIIIFSIKSSLPVFTQLSSAINK